VIRSGVHSRLMMRTLFTPLCTPYAARARASSSGKTYFVDAPKRLLEVGHDLLRPNQQDDLPGAGCVGPQLAATGGCGDQRPSFGDGVDTTDHDVG
jgi:hypothetical protein